MHKRFSYFGRNPESEHRRIFDQSTNSPEQQPLQPPLEEMPVPTLDPKHLASLLGKLEQSGNLSRKLGDIIHMYLDNDLTVAQNEVRALKHGIQSSIDAITALTNTEKQELFTQLDLLANIAESQQITQILIDGGVITQEAFDQIAKRKQVIPYRPGRLISMPKEIAKIMSPIPEKGTLDWYEWRDQAPQWFTAMAEEEMGATDVIQNHVQIMMREKAHYERTKRIYPVTRYNYYNDWFEERYGVRFSGVGIYLDQLEDAKIVSPNSSDKRRKENSTWTFSVEQQDKMNTALLPNIQDPRIFRDLRKGGRSIRDHNTAAVEQGKRWERKKGMQVIRAGNGFETMTPEEAKEATGIDPIKIPFGRTGDKIAITYSTRMAPSVRSTPGKNTSQIWINNDGVLKTFFSKGNERESASWKSAADSLGIQVVQDKSAGVTTLVFTKPIEPGGFLQVTEISGGSDTVAKRIWGTENGSQVIDIDNPMWGVSAPNYKDHTGADAEVAEALGIDRLPNWRKSDRQIKREMLREDAEKLWQSRTPLAITEEAYEFLTTNTTGYAGARSVIDSRLIKRKRDLANNPYLLIGDHISLRMANNQQYSSLDLPSGVPVATVYLYNRNTDQYLETPNKFTALKTIEEWLGATEVPTPPPTKPIADTPKRAPGEVTEKAKQKTQEQLEFVASTINDFIRNGIDGFTAIKIPNKHVIVFTDANKRSVGRLQLRYKEGKPDFEFIPMLGSGMRKSVSPNNIRAQVQKALKAIQKSADDYDKTRAEELLPPLEEPPHEPPLEELPKQIDLDELLDQDLSRTVPKSKAPEPDTTTKPSEAPPVPFPDERKAPEEDADLDALLDAPVDTDGTREPLSSARKSVDEKKAPKEEPESTEKAKVPEYVQTYLSRMEKVVEEQGYTFKSEFSTKTPLAGYVYPHEKVRILDEDNFTIYSFQIAHNDKVLIRNVLSKGIWRTVNRMKENYSIVDYENDHQKLLKVFLEALQQSLPKKRDIQVDSEPKAKEEQERKEAYENASPEIKAFLDQQHELKESYKDGVIYGNVSISMDKPLPLPKGIRKIEGTIQYLDETADTSAPDLEEVTGTLTYWNSPVESLPPKLQRIGGYLGLQVCKNITGFSVKEVGMVQIRECQNFTDLPEGLTCSELSIEGCPKFSKIPKVNVNGDVSLSGHMTVAVGPANITGDLYTVYDAKITELSGALQVGGRISYGNLVTGWNAELGKGIEPPFAVPSHLIDHLHTTNEVKEALRKKAKEQDPDQKQDDAPAEGAEKEEQIDLNASSRKLLDTVTKYTEKDLKTDDAKKNIKKLAEKIWGLPDESVEKAQKWAKQFKHRNFERELRTHLLILKEGRSYDINEPFYSEPPQAPKPSAPELNPTDTSASKTISKADVPRSGIRVPDSSVLPTVESHAKRKEAPDTDDAEFSDKKTTVPRSSVGTPNNDVRTDVKPLDPVEQGAQIIRAMDLGHKGLEGVEGFSEERLRSDPAFSIAIQIPENAIDVTGMQLPENYNFGNNKEVFNAQMRIAVARFLYNRKLEPTKKNIDLAWSSIREARERYSDLSLFRDRSVSYLTHSELRSYQQNGKKKQSKTFEDPRYIAGIKAQKPKSAEWIKSTLGHEDESNARFLASIRSTKGPATFMYRGHGVESGLANGSNGKAIHYKRLAEALVARMQANPKPEDTVLILDACYSTNIVMKLREHMRQRGAKSLPIMIAEAGYGQLGYHYYNGSDYFMEYVLGIGKQEKSTLGSVYENEFKTLSNPTIHVDTRDGGFFQIADIEGDPENLV